MKFEVEDLKKIHMLPGETLVIRCKSEITPKVVRDSIRKQFEEKYPENDLLFIPYSMEIYKLISEEA